MELVPILTRAESLFRRFERTVQTIDKKNNFPAPPSARQRISSPDHDASPDTSAKGKSPQRAAFSSGSSVAQHVARGVGVEKEQERVKIVSPELRQLLSRQVLTLNSREIREHSAVSGKDGRSENVN